MAEVSSGSFNTTGYSDAYSPDHYVFSWSLVSQSIVDNTTTIDWSVVAAGGVTSGYYNSVKEKYVTVYGTTKSNSDWQTVYNGTVSFSGTTIIKHDSNGKGSFSASCGGAFEYSGSYNSTGSGSWDLPTIQRATKPSYSATTANLGGTITITLSPANSTFKHKVRYFFGNLKNQVSGLSIGEDFTVQGNSTVTFNIPTSLGSEIPNTFSGICQVSCYTYTSSGTHIGTETTNITLNIPSYTPTITGVTLTGNNLLSSAYVSGKSTVTVNANVATQYGAKIKSISTVIDGKTYTELPFTTDTLSSGSKTAKITFVDTRDKSVTVESAAIQVYAYSLPDITEFTLQRQADGTTVIATVKGSISAINNKNSKTIKVTLNGVTNTVQSSTYTINATTTFTNVSTDKTFTAKASFTDYYITVERESVLPTIEVTMDFLADGTGIALGKVAEHSNTFDCNWDILVKGKQLIDYIYPVGSIYISANNTSPNILFGGTWESFGTGRTLVGVDDSQTEFNSVLKTGGAKTHTLTVAQMPSHEGHMYDNFNDSGWADRGSDTNSYYLNVTGAAGYGQYENRPYKVVSGNELVMQGYSKGGGQAHNNLQPYITVYMWKRTA